ncbi:hypothetical protein ACWEJ6_48335 [Nonomuraea sp. NPDC004702]
MLCAGLRPAIDREDLQAATLTDSAVKAVLSGIGCGPADEGRTWVAVDGRWANGVLTGSWHKSDAPDIGEGARETARRTRLAALGEGLEQANVRIDDPHNRLA